MRERQSHSASITHEDEKLNLRRKEHCQRVRGESFLSAPGTSIPRPISVCPSTRTRTSSNFFLSPPPLLPPFGYRKEGRTARKRGPLSFSFDRYIRSNASFLPIISWQIGERERRGWSGSSFRNNAPALALSHPATTWDEEATFVRDLLAFSSSENGGRGRRRGSFFSTFRPGLERISFERERGRRLHNGVGVARTSEWVFFPSPSLVACLWALSLPPSLSILWAVGGRRRREEEEDDDKEEGERGPTSGGRIQPRRGETIRASG